MYDELLKMQLIIELQNLVKDVEKLEEYQDSYCEFMKEMILNTYSVN